MEVLVSDVLESIEAINEQLNDTGFAFQIYAIGGGYQFLTKPEYQDTVSVYLKQKSKKKLSASALETLAIIAYKQPITRSAMEQIRGVGCDYAVQKLLEKELIEIKGKADTIGRPVLYGTSQKFMDYFGINHIKDLPQLKDFATEENVIGEIAD
jgi:segregation and condensation protein B